MARLEEDSRIQSGDTVSEISHQNQIVSKRTWGTKEIEEDSEFELPVDGRVLCFQGSPPSHQLLLMRDQVRWTQDARPRVRAG